MSNLREIYFAGGCYWGTEHFFKLLHGVVDTEVGFANGKTETQPTYEEVCKMDTGFAETVHVVYDKEIISLETLLKYYFLSIDPTSVNRQGEDVGVQYRTGIYYTNAEDAVIIENAVEKLAKQYEAPIAVEREPLRAFFSAKEEHQDYLEKNPQGYCHISKELFQIAQNTTMPLE